MGFFSILFLIFLVLKLFGTIDWSWWWVTAPLWGTALFLLVYILTGATFIRFFVRTQK